MWRYIDAGMIDGFYSAALFESVGRHVGADLVPQTILFWRLRSTCVYIGYHQCVEDEINAEFCSANNVGIVRRILGGGCGFCDKDQILYSVTGREGDIIPRDIQAAYNKVIAGVVIALEALGVGAEIEPSRNAVYSRGRKISGNAQGRFNGAVMINGSLLLDFDFGLMDKVLKNPTKNLLNAAHAKEGMITLREMGICNINFVKKSLRQGFEKVLGTESQEGELTESETEMANQLREKYLQHDWVYKMDIKRELRKKSVPR